MVGQTLPPAFESANAAVTGSDRAILNNLLTTSPDTAKERNWDAKKRVSTSLSRLHDSMHK